MDIYKARLIFPLRTIRQRLTSLLALEQINFFYLLAVVISLGACQGLSTNFHVFLLQRRMVQKFDLPLYIQDGSFVQSSRFSSPLLLQDHKKVTLGYSFAGLAYYGQSEIVSPFLIIKYPNGTDQCTQAFQGENITYVQAFESGQPYAVRGVQATNPQQIWLVWGGGNQTHNPSGSVATLLDVRSCQILQTKRIQQDEGTLYLIQSQNVAGRPVVGGVYSKKVNGQPYSVLLDLEEAADSPFVTLFWPDTPTVLKDFIAIQDGFFVAAWNKSTPLGSFRSLLLAQMSSAWKLVQASKLTISIGEAYENRSFNAPVFLTEVVEDRYVILIGSYDLMEEGCITTDFTLISINSSTQTLSWGKHFNNTASGCYYPISLHVLSDGTLLVVLRVYEEKQEANVLGSAVMQVDFQGKVQGMRLLKDTSASVRGSLYNNTLSLTGGGTYGFVETNFTWALFLQADEIQNYQGCEQEYIAQPMAPLHETDWASHIHLEEVNYNETHLFLNVSNLTSYFIEASLKSDQASCNIFREIPNGFTCNGIQAGIYCWPWAYFPFFLVGCTVLVLIAITGMWEEYQNGACPQCKPCCCGAKAALTL